MYSYIGGFITHLHRDHRATILYRPAEQLPDAGFAIVHHSILLPFVYQPHRDTFLHPSDNDPSDLEANCETVCIHPEQPTVRIQIYGTPHMDNRLAGKPISNK